MTFFKSLEKLIAADMTVKIEVKSAGNGQFQLYIATAPKSGDNKQTIPPVGLKASPEELDAKVPEFMLTYADGALSLGEQFERANQAVKDAEAAAKQRRDEEAAKRTTNKPAPSKGPTSPGKPTGASQPKARNASDGLIDLEDPDGEDPDGGDDTTVTSSDKSLFF